MQPKTNKMVKTYLLNKEQERQHGFSKHDHWKHYTNQGQFLPA
jgi:hypothetical protein